MFRVLMSICLLIPSMAFAEYEHLPMSKNTASYYAKFTKVIDSKKSLSDIGLMMSFLPKKVDSLGISDSEKDVLSSRLMEYLASKFEDESKRVYKPVADRVLISSALDQIRGAKTIGTLDFAENFVTNVLANTNYSKSGYMKIKRVVDREVSVRRAALEESACQDYKVSDATDRAVSLSKKVENDPLTVDEVAELNGYIKLCPPGVIKAHHLVEVSSKALLDNERYTPGSLIGNIERYKKLEKDIYRAKGDYNTQKMYISYFEKAAEKIMKGWSVDEGVLKSLFITRVDNGKVYMPIERTLALLSMAYPDLSYVGELNFLQKEISRVARRYIGLVDLSVVREEIRSNGVVGLPILNVYNFKALGKYSGEFIVNSIPFYSVVASIDEGWVDRSGNKVAIMFDGRGSGSDDSVKFYGHLVNYSAAGDRPPYVDVSPEYGCIGVKCYSVKALSSR